MAEKFNTDREQTPRYMERRIKLKKKCRRITLIGEEFKILLCALLAVVIFAIGFIIPLRPTESGIEKRELTKFPKFTISSFLDGEFFKGVETWYADTFPFREKLISLNNGVKELYGFGETKFIGDKVQSDKIPEVSDDEPEFISPVSSSTESSDVSSDTSSEVSSEVSSDVSSDTSSEVSSEVSSAVSSGVEETYPDEDDDGPVQSPQMVNSVYLLGDTAFGLYGFSQSASDYYSSIVNDAADLMVGKANVYSIIAPVSYSMYMNQATQDSLGLSSNADAIKYMNSLMNSNVKKVPIYSNLYAHKDEYIYFRTDHHWTALGAYRAYEVFCNVKGITAHPLSYFETITFERFMGTLYSACDAPAAMEANPDFVTAYIPRGTNSLVAVEPNGNVFDWPIINDVSEWAYHSKYSCFSAGDQAFETIHNETITDGSVCLVVKDSYGNAFVPFMVDHYEYVYVADPRYCDEGLAEIVDTYGVDDVIFVHNIVTTGATVLSDYVYDFVHK